MSDADFGLLVLLTFPGWMFGFLGFCFAIALGYAVAFNVLFNWPILMVMYIVCRLRGKKW